MKTRDKKKIQKNKISALKKECSFLLQQKRGSEAKLKAQEDTLKDIRSLVDSILIGMALEHDNEITIKKVSLDDLKKYNIETASDDKGYHIKVTEK